MAPLRDVIVKINVEPEIPAWLRAGLRSVGWLEPDRATEMQLRTAAVLKAAYAYVDLPHDVPFNPEVDDRHPGQTLYEELAAAIEAHRAYVAEVQP